MNGAHDMGGMHGMGPIEYEKDEPVFHEAWEARVYAMNRAMGAAGKWSIDASRHEKELIPAAEYFGMSYYERFFVGLVSLLAKTHLITPEEIRTGKPDAGSVKATPALTADMVPKMVLRGAPASRESTSTARFKLDQTVRARNMNPTGHTRLPRYARGKVGTIVRQHGVFVFPDTSAHFLGENPQHLYSVRFTARELWGEDASRHDTVHVDMWEDYLEEA
jgi:nitrile hydratase subunit beta